MTEDGQNANAWRLQRPQGSPLHSHENGMVAVPLQITRGGKPVVQVALVMSLSEAEFLHAQLCHALDGEPASIDAPECRHPIQRDPRRRPFSAPAW